MERTVDILFVIGVAVNLVKGADLILRPHQQKWLQAKWESITLWLDYSKPIDWFFTRGKMKRLFWYSYLVVFPIVVLELQRQVLGPSSWVTYLTIAAFVTFYFILDAKYLITGEKPTVRNEPPGSGTKLKIRVQFALIEWVLKSPKLPKQIVRLTLLALLGSSLVFLGNTGIKGLIHLERASRWTFIILVFLFHRLFFYLLDSYLVVIAVGVVSIIALIVCWTIFIVEFVLKILRGIAWRIAEYNKGAFAAMILLVTVTLGIAEVYLKTRNQFPPVTPIIAPTKTPQNISFQNKSFPNVRPPIYDCEFVCQLFSPLLWNRLSN